MKGREELERSKGEREPRNEERERGKEVDSTHAQTMFIAIIQVNP